MAAANRDRVMMSAKQFINFINKSPSPFHAVDVVCQRLRENGFTELKESTPWHVKPMDKCFVTKNQTTVIAFAVGGNYKPGNGFSIIGAHTDSPCLRVKPVSKKSKQGFSQVGVETYGGGIWNTWFDRDLTVAGRVLVKDKINNTVASRLVHIQRPILRIPHLAIHLQRSINSSFGPNPEDHLTPILATQVQAELNCPSGAPMEGTEQQPQSQASKHPPMLVKVVCDELHIDPDQMMDFELCLADTQPAAIGGACEEFLFSPRLDNLFNAYTATEGLVQSLGNLAEDRNVRMISLFDNEEVGSQSAQGAASTFQELVMRRLSSSPDNPTAFEESIGLSYMVSADQAHGCHPNYSDKHESNHQPAFDKGIVIKFNSNQKYATTSVTATILRLIAQKVSVPLQDVMVRNDSTCGSTIGPIMSAKLGMQTIDLGAAQFAMHSIREMGATVDVHYATELFKGFFVHYPDVQASLKF